MVVAYGLFDLAKLIFVSWFNQNKVDKAQVEKDQRHSEQTSNTLLNLLGGAITELRVAVSDLTTVVSSMKDKLDPDATEKLARIDKGQETQAASLRRIEDKQDLILAALLPKPEAPVEVHSVEHTETHPDV